MCCVSLVEWGAIVVITAERAILFKLVQYVLVSRVYPLPCLHSMWLLSFWLFFLLLAILIAWLSCTTSPPLISLFEVAVESCWLFCTWDAAMIVDCIMLMGCTYLLQCWNGSVIRGSVCSVLPMSFDVVCSDMCPCLHVNLATVTTAVVLLLFVTVISPPTYYYFRINITVRFVSPPPF